MPGKYLLTFIILFHFIACDTQPKNDQDNSINKEEKNTISPEANYDIGNNASIIAMADIIKPEDEEFSGKAYFTTIEDDFTLTVILNNAETNTYPVYLTKEGDCNNEKINIKDLKEESTDKNVGSVKVLNNGSGRSEILLNEFSKIQKEKIMDYNIIIAETDGEIIGCGEIKKYIEEKNLSNAAN